MDKLNIIYVDDQREVLSTLSKDLQVFEDYLILEECESALEAIDLMDEIDANGDYTAVIISDHIMPDMSGVEFLTKVNKDNRFANTKKIMLTGQATHHDTIEAINFANIQKYVEKPWEPEQMVKSVKILLTQFLFEQGLPYKKYMPILHQATLFEHLHRT